MSAEINESVVKTDRYVKAHGKRPASGHGNWMFTTKATGDVDWKKEGEEYIQVAGDFKTAKAKAERWAKDNGHRAVYVMESVELDEAKINDNDFVHIKKAGTFYNPKKDTIIGYSKALNDPNRTPKLKSGANAALRVKLAKEKGYDIKEEISLDESFTDKEIKMAYGILNDPRYKGGNLTKAIDKIEKIKRGLSKHPGVQKAMKATSESVKLEESSTNKFHNAVKLAIDAHAKGDSYAAKGHLKDARSHLFKINSADISKIDVKIYRQYQGLTKKILESKYSESVNEGKGGAGKRLSFVKDQGDDHIIMQLRSAQDLGGMKPIKFRGGKEGRVPQADIDTILKAHELLSPEGKRKLRVMISKSPADLTKAATELRKAIK